jgi:hypothetical protein
MAAPSSRLLQGTSASVGKQSSKDTTQPQPQQPAVIASYPTTNTVARHPQEHLTDAAGTAAAATPKQSVQEEEEKDKVLPNAPLHA